MLEGSTSTEIIIEKDNFSEPFQTSEDIQSQKLKPEDIVISENVKELESQKNISADEENLIKDNDDENSSTKPDSQQKLEFDPECKICKKKFYSRSSYITHIESSRHKRRILPGSLEKIKCEICDSVFLSRSLYEKHLVGKRHKRWSLTRQLEKKFQAEKELLPTDKAVRRQNSSACPIRCKPCNKKFNNLITYDLHMSSRSHNEMAVKNVVEKLTYCEVCKMPFSGLYNYEIHLSSPIHIRNLQRAETISRNQSSFHSQ